jgi:hypothetical protein
MGSVAKSIVALSIATALSGCANFGIPDPIPSPSSVVPATRWAASLGQAGDVGTTAWALSQGAMEGNPLLNGLNTGSAVTMVVFGLKPFVPYLAQTFFPKADCYAVNRGWGLMGWGAAGANIATTSFMVSPLGAVGYGVLTALVLEDWVTRSAEKACKGRPSLAPLTAEQQRVNSQKTEKAIRDSHAVWLD